MNLFSVVFLTIMGFATAAAADLNRGKELYSQGKYAEAQSELNAVTRANDSDSAAHRYLGLALIEQNKVSEAARHIEKAAELDASGDNKLALARLYVAQKEYDKADEAMKDASGDELEYVRGLLRLNRREFDAAVKDLESYISKNPDQPYAHYYAGLAYNGLKKPDKMLSHFQHFVQLKPDAPEARKVRAVLQTGR